MRFIFIAAFLFGWSLNAHALVGISTNPSIKTNPTANLVMAQTAALNSPTGSASANWQVVIWWTCSVSATYQYQVMNGASVVASIPFPCIANTFQEATVPGMSFGIPSGYTLEMINVNGFTGTGSVEIYTALEGYN
jgi:hypothetical protein